ncbi:anti-sigma-factor antagonist [Solidesulfovibrio fructosivorans JJ]]|uniref:Anti-sigma factor antagonist n=1 Tax=Solidesulfovibrio fructosivorans JJ] TaxID=596151 RepID=E1JS86_SOLFR|nr:STAS domain-containing protein [Solidesulfovibrio fructosivorans]EFL52855.1 anti-sigma-factor antagonist [Solidesulfovibrio fructosivorans JJ]]
MDLTTTLHGTCLVVEIHSPEVDHTVSEDFKEAVLARFETSGARELLLDLGPVSFLDSKAIGAMVSVRKTVTAKGGKLGLYGLQPNVAKIIRVVTLGTLFEVYPDLQTALERACG